MRYLIASPHFSNLERARFRRQDLRCRVRWGNTRFRVDLQAVVLVWMLGRNAGPEHRVALQCVHVGDALGVRDIDVLLRIRGYVTGLREK